MIETTYNKTAGLTGFAPSVLRFLPSQIARLWHTYIAHVRPFEVILTRQLHGDKAAKEMETFAFCSKGARWSPDRVRTSFTTTMLEHALPISWAHYRQMAVAFMRHLQIPESIKVYLDAAAQAGHSVATDEDAYGRSFAEDRSTPDEKVRRFRLTSNTWHLWLHLK